MKKKILFLIGISVFSIWLIIALLIYQNTKKELSSIMDAQLKQAAKVLLEEGSHELKELSYEKSQPLHFDHELPEDDEKEYELSFQIRSEDGLLIMRSSDLIPETPLTHVSSGYDTQLINNEQWRIFSLWTKNKDLQVQVAQKIAVRNSITRSFRKQLLLPVIIFLPLLLFFVFMAIKSGLKPVQQLSDEIKNRGPKDLKAVDANKYPIELTPIVMELNQLLERLLTAIESEKRLTADAAHELRTPLAALKVQAQVALESTDISNKNSSLTKINAVIDGLSRRVSQLLMLAKLDNEVFQLEKSDCDINLIVKNELAELAPQILSKDIQIHFSEQKILLKVYPDLMAVMARNLIENAVKHTPSGGEIDIQFIQREKSICLQIINSGNGIPEQDIENLFKRFYQPKGSNKEGSGLGLSIVKKIADLHQAHLNISNLLNPNTVAPQQPDAHEAKPFNGLKIEIEFFSSECS